MNTTMKPVPRSMLFTPATKASRFDKAAEVGAAAVILDLEDSVATAAKDQARRAALNYLGSDLAIGGADGAADQRAGHLGRLARPDRAVAVVLRPGFFGNPEG